MLMEVDKEIEELNKKISRVLSNESKIMKKLDHIEQQEIVIEKEERQEIKEEKSIESLEHEEVDELKKLEALEQEVKRSVVPHPLTKVTYRDVIKGTIGAFVGIVGHFSFLEAVHHSEHMSYLRATMLLVTSFIIGVLFIYFSGFRKVKEVRVLSFIPIRVTLIFCVAISVILITLALFGVITTESSLEEVYKMVSTTSILAMLGAGTADLIGER